MVYVRLQVFVVLVTDFLGRYEKVGFSSLPNLLDKVKKTAKRHAGYLPWEGAHGWPASPAESLSTPRGHFSGLWIGFIYK